MENASHLYNNFWATCYLLYINTWKSFSMCVVLSGDFKYNLSLTLKCVDEYFSMTIYLKHTEYSTVSDKIRISRGKGGVSPYCTRKLFVCVCVFWLLCNLDWSLFQPLGGQVWGGLREPLLPRHSQLLPGQENQWGLCKCHMKCPTRGTKDLAPWPITEHILMSKF